MFGNITINLSIILINITLLLQKLYNVNMFICACVLRYVANSAKSIKLQISKQL